ncbi:hypothetical protein NR798_39395 [Archangium gephyra]|uniref:hypothetical protein n=1 Tax=Archangium gephyra TaxID=48 RepID=UPI0035D52683
MRSLCTALFFSLLLATVAHAAPAVVKVFEAKAHAQPDATSPVLHTFVEKAELSVSEEAEAGWRRVRLPDGNVGYIQESALRLVTAEAAPPATPAPAPATPPAAAQAPAVDRPVLEATAPAPKIYVKDLEHLAELVKEDDLVGPKAQQLSERRKTSLALGIGGVAVGVVVSVLGMASRSEQCEPSRFPGSDPFCVEKPNFGMMYGGLGVAVGSVLLSYALMPKAGDLLDVINEWNTRHPANPFELNGNGAPPSR